MDIFLSLYQINHIKCIDPKQVGATQYHAQLGLTDKGRAIEGLIVCNKWKLERLNHTY